MIKPEITTKMTKTWKSRDIILNHLRRREFAFENERPFLFVVVVALFLLQKLFLLFLLLLILILWLVSDNASHMMTSASIKAICLSNHFFSSCSCKKKFGKCVSLPLPLPSFYDNFSLRKNILFKKYCEQQIVLQISCFSLCGLIETELMKTWREGRPKRNFLIQRERRERERERERERKKERESIYVWVCVCERERERGRE